MKREIKDVILVSTVTLVLMLGVILSAVLININAFTDGKKITLRINYANHVYEYKNLKTDSDNVYGLLRDYNEKLALSLEVAGLDDITALYSLKGTDINTSKHYSYLIKINGEYHGHNLAEIKISDGDIVSIDYINNEADAQFTSTELVSGGDSKLTYYNKVSITLYSMAATILIPVIVYIIIAFINLRRNNHIAANAKSSV